MERAHCLIDNLRLYEAEAAYHYAAHLVPDRFFINRGWSIASLLRVAIKETFERAHSAGQRAVDLRTLRLPEHEAWQRDMAPHACECLERIVRIHAQKTVPANNQFFAHLAQGQCRER